MISRSQSETKLKLRQSSVWALSGVKYGINSKCDLHITEGGNKGLYMVERNFFLHLLNCSAWPCLGPA